MFRFIFIAIFLFSGIGALACDCSVIRTTFCESIISPNGEVWAQFILIGKVSIDSEGRREIEVKDLYFGELDSNTLELRFTDCEYGLIPIENNNEYLFALGKHNDYYYLVGCGVGHLKVEGNEIVGPIAPGIDKIKIDELNDLPNCGDAFIPFSDQIELYPNPTTDIVVIKSIDDEAKLDDLRVRIFDSSGRFITAYKNTDAIETDKFFEIYIKDLPSGVYMIQLLSKSQSTTKKLVKI